MINFIFSETFLQATIISTIPILFASLAALVSNKAGTININIEGSMAIAALTGALVSHYSNSWVAGLLMAVLAGIAMSMILAYASLKIKANTILVGIVLNTFATGLSVFVLFSVLGVKGDSALAPSTVIPDINIPLLSKIPFVGKLLFGQNILVYLAFISVIVIHFVMKKTKLGLRIKAVGENPEASLSVGIKVNRTKVYALILCGTFAGLGGAYLSMVYLSYFSAGMVAGRGFIGIAAEAMGSGNPIFTMLFALLFGAVDYFAVGGQSVLSAPYELLNTLPYLMTIIALILYSLKANKKIFKRKNKEVEIKEKK